MPESPDFELTHLPDLHPDAIGATINGVHYTRAEYEAIQKRSLMPDSPDFDQIAQDLLLKCDDEAGRRHVAAQLRQVWNARGAADLQQIDVSLTSQMGATASGPYVRNLEREIRKLDR
jgi:hypothetical protein